MASKNISLSLRQLVEAFSECFLPLDCLWLPFWISLLLNFLLRGRSSSTLTEVAGFSLQVSVLCRFKARFSRVFRNGLFSPSKLGGIGMRVSSKPKTADFSLKVGVTFFERPLAVAFCASWGRGSVEHLESSFWKRKKV